MPDESWPYVQDGQGVKSDLVEAYKWFYLASNQGDGVATHYLEEIEGSGRVPEKVLAETRRQAATSKSP